jgi:hypothetical protein
MLALPMPAVAEFLVPAGLTRHWVVSSAAAQGASDLVKDLLKRLEDELLSVRSDAQAELLRLEGSGSLTTADRQEILRVSRTGAELETRSRAGAIVEDILGKITQVQDVVTPVKTKVDFSPKGDLFRFKFDDFGTIPLPLGRALNPTQTTLTDKYNAFQNGVLRGDFSSAEARLAELRAFINGLTDGELQSLGLRELGMPPVPVTKQDLLDKIEQAKEKLRQAEEKVREKFGEDPGPLLESRVDTPGKVDLGKTFQLEVEGLAGQGNLAVLFHNPENGIGLPPEGCDVVGFVFDLVPDGDLLIFGKVVIGIQYSEMQLFGNPELLQIARFANGELQILETVFNDLENHIIFASYEASLGGAGVNQFGEFALIQLKPIPEPSTLALLGIGTLGLLGYGCRRRKRVAM